MFLKDYHILYFTTTTILTINAIAIKDYYNLSVALGMIRSLLVWSRILNELYQIQMMPFCSMYSTSRISTKSTRIMLDVVYFSGRRLLRFCPIILWQNTSKSKIISSNLKFWGLSIYEVHKNIQEKYKLDKCSFLYRFIPSIWFLFIVALALVVWCLLWWDDTLPCYPLSSPNSIVWKRHD